MVNTSTQKAVGSSTCTVPEDGRSLEIRDQRVPPEGRIYSSLASKTPVILLPAPSTVAYGLPDDKVHVGQHISGGE